MGAPSEAPARSRGWAGPWLLFKGGTGGSEERNWRGSVLFLTCTAGAALAAAPAAAAAPSSAAAAAPAPAQVPQQPAAGAAQPPTNGGMPAAPEQPAVAGVTPQPPAAAAAQAPPTLQLTDDTASGQRTIQAVQLDVAAGWTFWRFDLQLELTAWQVRMR